MFNLHHGPVAGEDQIAEECPEYFIWPKFQQKSQTSFEHKRTQEDSKESRYKVCDVGSASAGGCKYIPCLLFFQTLFPLSSDRCGVYRSARGHFAKKINKLKNEQTGSLGAKKPNASFHQLALIAS